MATLDKNNVESIVPLTPMQEGLLFHYLKDDQNGVQNFEQICLHLNGDFDLLLFEKSWAQVVESNEMLRTLFRWEKMDKPVQITLKKLVPRIKVLDVRTEENKGKLLENARREDKKLLFDLEDVPFRIQVIRTSDKDFTMMISNHSIIYDGWSNGIVLKEFFESYIGRLKGNQVLTPAKVPFKTFVKALQNQTIDEGEAENFWKSYFKEQTVLQSLPFKDKNGSGKIVSQEHVLKLETALVAKMSRFCKERKITSATLLYGIWGLVLQKVTNKKDVVFGTTVSGRNMPLQGIEQMVGLFINTLPLRVCNQEQTLEALLFEIARHLSDRESFEQSSLIDIKKWGNFPQGESIFDTIVLIENYPLDTGLFKDNSECRLSDFSFDQTNNFDLAISILNFENEIDVFLSYNQNTLSVPIIEKLAQAFKTVASTVVEFPELKISQIDILGKEAKQEILHQFNATKKPYAETLKIQELFEHWARENPNRIALTMGKHQISYGYLDQKANAIAHELHRHLGEGNHLVPVLMERSIAMVATLIGILKAGYAYVPFEPSLPFARVEKLINALEIPLLCIDADRVLTGQKLCAVAETMQTLVCIEDDADTVALDQDLFVVERNTLQQLPPKVNSNNDALAYVIFTSGSTGLPKGVSVAHKPVINVIEWVNKTLRITEKDRLLFVTSFGFDLSVYDIFGVLGAGASLYIEKQENIGNAEAILNSLIQQQITIWDSAPAAFQQVVQVGLILQEQGIENQLRQVLLSGDWIGLKLPEDTRALFGEKTKIISLGGATEAVIWSNYFQFDKVHPSWKSIPYGKPIQNAKYYILDDDLNVMPKGFIGELFIGGECLANAYIKEPQLTSEKFLPNPYATGERIYRTGDLARWFEDGNIELIGRKDHQVKIRGFRVELGEIESKLIQFPGLNAVALLMEKNNSGDNYIAAFYVSNVALSEQEIQSFLQLDLPAYMVPSVLMRIPEIPVTANGKLDRKALQSTLKSFHSKAVAVELATSQEKELAALWSDVLKVELSSIGSESSFFELGGHSLSATLLQARIKKKMGAQVALRTIFNYPLLAQLAEQIEEEKNKGNRLTPVAPRAYYPLTSGQKRLYALQNIQKNSTFFNITGAVQLKGDLQLDKLIKAFEKVVLVHDALRTCFGVHGEEIMQKVKDELPNTCKVITINESEFHGDFSSYMQVFDLKKGPLIQATIFKTENPNLHYLLLDMHHIVSDGLSVRKILNDLMKAYEGADLVKPAIQFQDYAVLESTKGLGKTLQVQENFWKSQFSNGVERLQLPLDYKRPAIRSAQGNHLQFYLNQDQTTALQKLAEAQEATLFVVFVSLLNVLLYKVSKQKTITIGTPVANRSHAELEDTVGFFVNTIALVNEIDSAYSFKEWIQVVRSATLRALSHQEYPFESLVELLGEKEVRGQNPVFDVVLDYNNLELPELEFSGLQAKEMPPVFKRADFDLVFHISPKKDGMEIKLDYATKLFAPSTIVWLKDEFVSVIDSIIAEPSSPIAVLLKEEHIHQDSTSTIAFDF